MIQFLFFKLVCSQATSSTTTSFVTSSTALIATTAVLSSCNMFDNNATACAAAVSNVNGLLCDFVLDQYCIDRADCKECFNPSNGVCRAACSTASCASIKCPDARCDVYLAGWNDVACERFSEGGVCSSTACVSQSAIQSATSATRAVLCDGQGRRLLASCGSLGCRRLDRCVAGEAATAGDVSFFCYQRGQNLCGPNEHCDSTGTCVVDTACSKIDRVSDCSLVTLPPTNQPCLVRTRLLQFSRHINAGNARLKYSSSCSSEL